MSLARQTRDHVLSIINASVPATGGGLSPDDLQPEISPYTPAAEVAARQIAMRMNHDLRRLKEIKAIDRKIAAKRDMLPEYRAWCDGLLEAGHATVGRELGSSGADEVLPVALVWSIDVGDWPRALELAAHVLRFDVKLPARYNRDAATLVLEEIAEAALKAQARGDAFPLDVLEQVEELTAGIDMHDEPHAKLLKAIGAELVREAGAAEGDAILPTIDRAMAVLTRAQDLHDRAGVKTMLKGLEKAKIAATKLGEAEPAPSTGDTPPATPDQPAATLPAVPEIGNSDTKSEAGNTAA
jgi:hypothetical protein